jgi:hypothetical protein
MELDNFIIGKNRGELAKKKQLVLAKKKSSYYKRGNQLVLAQ